MSETVRLVLSATTIFASASLLFAVQPMVGKALLPRLGGVPGAWTACLLFFQAALLVGYGYVWLGRRWPLRARVAAHVVAVAAGAVVVPFAWLDGIAGLSPAEAPVGYALAFLAANVGLAFTLLSATPPLLSSWYAAAGGERPYALYSASNAGSLGALLLYPALVEPLLDLPAQALAFRVAFGVVAVGVLGAGVVAVRSGGRTPRAAVEEPAQTLTWRRRATWVGLAFVPTTLLAGATAYVSTDLAPLPLLWVLPLALYLLSFILAFSDAVGAPSPLVGRAACLVAVLLVFFTTTHLNEPMWLLSILHLGFLFAGSWIAHRRLASDAPHPAHLPEFYVWVALGGVLGTLVTGVIAPLVLPDLWEYPAAIALACTTREETGVVRPDRPWKTDVPHVIAVAALVVLSSWLVPALGIDHPSIVGLLSFGPAAVWAYRWMPLRRRYTLCLLAIMLAAGLTQERGDRRLTTRSFFGVLRVVDSGDERHLLHGTTLHGTQRIAQRDACVPQAYYVREGPLGAIFEAHRALGRRGRTVAVGLGTGAIACYSEPGEPWRVLEINPDVIDIASDRRWFTYLANAPSDRVEPSLGDGRLGLEEERDGSLALIVVDAFNSDSVPAHLLTREAVQLYLQKLEPGGWAVLHLSNRVLDLRRVVGDAVAAEGAAAVLADDAHATYAVIARSRDDLRALQAPTWTPLTGDPARAWTDAYSSVLTAF